MAADGVFIAALEEQLRKTVAQAQLPPTVFPDRGAMSKLNKLAAKWPGAAVATLEELAVNMGTYDDSSDAREVKKEATLADDGRRFHLTRVRSGPNRNNHLTNVSSISKALMAMINRWDTRYGLVKWPSPDVPSSSYATNSSDDASTPPEAPAIPPSAAIFTSPKRPWDGATDAREKRTRHGMEQEASPGPSLVDITAIEKLIHEECKKYSGSYDLRFRLHAIGAPTHFAKEPDKLKELIGALMAKQAEASCTPRELNQISAKYGAAHMSFGAPREGHGFIYQIKMKPDGSVLYELPVESGLTLASRRLGDALLKVSFVPLRKDATKDERDRHEKLKLRIYRSEKGALQVAGRKFVHFCHKDVEKSEGSSVWFIALYEQPNYRETPQVAAALKRNGGRWTAPEVLDALEFPDAKSAFFFRNYLLDTNSYKDGDESKGHLTASKLNARLTLAFSQTVSVRPCAPTHERVRDLRAEGAAAYSMLHELPPLPEGEVQLVIVDDLYGQSADGEPLRHRMMTDGAGMISHNLAQHIPACQNGQLRDGTGRSHSVPLLSQVRVWHRGYVAKGMLVANGTLPDGYIVCCASMVKVYGRTRCLLNRKSYKNERCSERSAFEVIQTSNFAREGRLTPQLVPLLEYGCTTVAPDGENRMVKLLLALQDLHIQRILELQDIDSLTGPQLRRLASELGSILDGAGIAALELLLCGFNPANEPWLRHKVAQALKTKIDAMAAGKIDAPGSVSLIGIPDFTHSLQPGEVAVVLNGSFFEDEVLIYRSPGCHPGDVRRAKAVVPPERLRALMAGAAEQHQFALFFSVQGDRALADMCSGGDYDGDTFTVFRKSAKVNVMGADAEPYSLYQAFDRESEPWNGNTPPLDPQAPAPRVCPCDDNDKSGKAERDTSKYLLEHLIVCEETKGQIGICAKTVQLATEAWGSGHESVDFLVGAYNGALDAGKNGGRLLMTRVNQIHHQLQAMGYPEFMEITDYQQRTFGRQEEGTSMSAMGKLHRNARAGAAATSESRVGEAPDMDLDLQVELVRCPHCGAEKSHAVLREHESFCREWMMMKLPRKDPLGSSLATEWARWESLLKAYNRDYKEFASVSDARGTRDRQAEGWRASYNAIIAKYRNELVNRYDEYEREHPPDELLRSASVLYQVCYQQAGQKNLQYGREVHTGLAFVWHVAGPYLCYIKGVAQNHRKHPGEPPRIVNTDILSRLIGKARRVTESAHEAEDDAAGPTEHADDDGDCVSTPWSRGA